MTGNMKKLPEIVSASKELAAEERPARAKRPAPASWAAVSILTAASAVFALLAETETGKRFFGRANQAGGHSGDENKRFELSDDELDQVVGGVSVGDRVKMDSRMVRYCPGCGKLASVVYGTDVGKMYYEKGGCFFVNVKSDCCGYVDRALESICTVQ